MFIHTVYIGTEIARRWFKVGEIVRPLIFRNVDIVVGILDLFD